MTATATILPQHCGAVQEHPIYSRIACPVARGWLERGVVVLPVAFRNGSKQPTNTGKGWNTLKGVMDPRYLSILEKTLKHGQPKGWGRYTNEVGCIDIDLKRFPDADSMEQAVKRLTEVAPNLTRTLSGGIHIDVEGNLPRGGNIGLDSIPRIGELLGKDSEGNPQFVVFSGPGYEVIKLGEPLKVDSLSDYGITLQREHKASVEAPVKPPALQVIEGGVRGFLPLQQALAKKAQSLINGDPADTSDALAAIAREAYGWENVALSEGVPLDKSADSLIAEIAEKWERTDKLSRILASINRESCTPALEYTKGRDAVINRLKYLSGQREPSRKPVADVGEIILSPEDTPGSVCMEHLFSEGFSRIGDHYHEWVGTHYAKKDERSVRSEIADLLWRCQRMEERGKEGAISITYPYRKASAVKDAYEFCMAKIPFISADDVNPPGLNCINGVLTFDYVDGEVTVDLVPHSPKHPYVYEPLIKYDPDADDTDALRLIDAIGAEYQDAVLKNLAASFHLDMVRKRQGRSTRIMIFSGSGANGKDALREALSYIHSRQGVTSCTVSDFAEYERGRKFNLAPLAKSRINWPSENDCKANLDKLEPLKNAATGEPLVTEEKHQQGQEFTPKAVLIFNTNDPNPNLTASSEAIASRYCIVPFRKTFSSNPKGPHQMKADPRFKYDPEWVKENVCPGLLNILIEKFKAIFSEGIDYSPFEKVMEQNRKEVNHLLQFAEDVGLVESDDPTDWVSNEALWNSLKGWYESEGVLKVRDNLKIDWEEDTRAGDGWVKTSQQLLKRLRKIFPRIESHRTKYERGIKGIKFVDSCFLALENVKSAGDYSKIQELYTSEKIHEQWAKLSPEKQIAIAELMKPQAPQENTSPDDVAETMQGFLDAHGADCEGVDIDALALLGTVAGAATDEGLGEALKAIGYNAYHRLYELLPIDSAPLRERLQGAANSLSGDPDFNRHGF